MNEKLTLSAFSSYYSDQVKHCPGFQNSASAWFCTLSWRISFKRAFQFWFFLSFLRSAIATALCRAGHRSSPACHLAALPTASSAPSYPPSLPSEQRRDCARTGQQGLVWGSLSPGECTQSLPAPDTPAPKARTDDFPPCIPRASHRAVTATFL